MGHVLTGYGQNVGLLGAGQVGDVGVERDTLLGSGGLCDGHGDTEDGVGTQLFLVLGAIELVQEGIDSGLVLDVDSLLDECGRNGVVHVGNGLGDTLTAPLGLVSIAELAGFVGASGRAGGDDGAVQAGLGDNVDLNGRVALLDVSRGRDPMPTQTYARVVDRAGVDLGDGHDVVEAKVGQCQQGQLWIEEINCGFRRPGDDRLEYIGAVQPYDADSLELDARPQKADTLNRMRLATLSGHGGPQCSDGGRARDDGFGRGQECKGRF